MSNLVPVNALDAAIIALCRSKAATPEFYRQLAQGDLWFLLHYHPEIEGEIMELKNGDPVPFVVCKEEDREQVMLFSSEARVEEAMKNGRVPPRTFSAGSMPARQVLEVIGKCDLWAIINRSCGTGSMIIPPNLMRDLADGSALRPLTDPQERQHGRLKILNPADYPTALVQAVFECVRQHPQFRAVWIFGTVPPPAQGRGYQLLFYMEPKDDVVFHDVNMIIQAATADGDDVGLGQLTQDDMKRISGQVRPFYTAPDFHIGG